MACDTFWIALHYKTDGGWCFKTDTGQKHVYLKSISGTEVVPSVRVNFMKRNNVEKVLA